MVDLPAPDGPTSAVTVPGGASNDTSRNVGVGGSWANETRSNSTSCPVDERGSGGSGSAVSCSICSITAPP